MKNKIIFKTLMLKGEPGSTIVSMEKTGHVGTADIYTITFNDGSTTEISLENMSAITSVEMTSSTDTEDIYTITCADGSTQTFSVLNHNADIAAMSDDIDVMDARLDNFLATQTGVSNGTLRTETTLFSSTVPSMGNDENNSGYFDLEDSVDNYDEIVIRYSTFSGKSAVVTIKPDDIPVAGGSGSPLHWSEIEPNNQITVDAQNGDRSVHRFMSFTAYKFTDVDRISIDAFVWGWNGSANSNGVVSSSFTETWNSTNGAWQTSGFIGGIYSITGIKYEEAGTSKDPELVDIRVGADGTTYNSAGAAVRGQISDLKEDLQDISVTKDTSDSDADLYITDTIGNVLAEFSEGDFKTQKFNSAEVSGDSASSAELDLSTYPTVNYNFESGNTWTSGGYRGVMIPFEDLGDYVRFVATGNKIVFCFLTDNDITAGELPHTCSGCTPTSMSKGADVTFPVPSDCAYLYVYVSQNSAFIGTIHLYALVSSTKVKGMIADLQAQIDILKSQTGICYISDTEQIIRTLKHWHTNANGFRASATGDNLVTIAHISDVHNDPDAYGRFIDLLNDNVGVIDVGLVTGDLVDGPGTECFAEMVAEEDALVEGTKILKVVGNHDRISAPLTDLFTWMNMEISTDGTDLYYVHDFTAQKIRLIVLNQYEAISGTLGRTGYYTQTQLDWFVAKLAEAITNNYQVAVAFHAHMEAGLPTRNDKGFCQHDYNGQIESASGDHPIQDIIDAFQRGATINKSYTYTEQEVTVTVNTTFSAKGVFIAYICGHEHSDMIGYSKVYPNQLVCMVQGAVVDSTKRNEATAHWQGMYDTPRVSGTPTVDSINVYAIDPLARLVKVAKIGSTLTDKLVPRSFASFGY